LFPSASGRPFAARTALTGVWCGKEVAFASSKRVIAGDGADP
jgi:hypothetical protein